MAQPTKKQQRTPGLRRGLLKELGAVFDDAESLLGAGDPNDHAEGKARLDALRREVLGLLRPRWPARTAADVYEGGGLLVLATTAVRRDGGSYPALAVLARPGAKLDAYEVGALSRAVESWSSGLRSEARVEGNRAVLREREEPMVVDDHCGECGNSEPECTCPGEPAFTPGHVLAQTGGVAGPAAPAEE